EGYSNLGFAPGGEDPRFTASKFRMTMETGPGVSTKWKFVFKPQFTKLWGLTEQMPYQIGEGQRPTSGGVWDTRFDVHNAYIDWRPNDTWGFLIGRQTISYGDQLIIGALEWHNVGRAFDAVKLEFSYSDDVKVDVFYSDVVNNGVSSTGDGNSTFFGAYSPNKFGAFFRNTDLYFLYKRDHTQVIRDDHYDVWALGGRVKSKEGIYDHRIEATFEGAKVKGEDRNGEYQFDAEVGLQIKPIKTRLSVEYFQASKDYDQFYPTAHKWLGFADQFGRRNIKGFRVGLIPKITNKLKARLDFHAFYRTDNDAPTYNLLGKAYKDSVGDESEDYALATEFDIKVFYDVYKNLRVEGGFAYVMPKGYMESLGRDEDVLWGYLSMAANF
ncbi:MAG: hypothetical protein DRQ88_10400, partial [Epsilonproteobacteria bacterium]